MLDLLKLLSSSPSDVIQCSKHTGSIIFVHRRKPYEAQKPGKSFEIRFNGFEHYKFKTTSQLRLQISQLPDRPARGDYRNIVAPIGFRGAAITTANQWVKRIINTNILSESCLVKRELRNAVALYFAAI
jgi:hypothetical protein